MIIRSEESFAEKKTLRFNLAQIILILSTIFLVLVIGSFYLSVTLLSAWFDPRSAELEANKQVIALSQAVDSLAIEVGRKDKFIESIKSILVGEEVGSSEFNSNNQKSIAGQPFDSAELSAVDADFRKQFEVTGSEILNIKTEYSGELQDLYLFQPLDNGIVVGVFNPAADHFGIDIVSKKDEPVKAIADGTVIFSSWTSDTGYVIAVQHRSNLISVYKHNSDLLKSIGNFVSAGEIISIIGNTGELTTGPHLHFELWYNGNALNPSEFLSF